MARISTYGVDAKPELQDKVLGTDTAAGANLRTKNYSLGEIVDLFNESNSLAIADQSVFKFQSNISKGSMLNMPIKNESIHTHRRNENTGAGHGIQKLDLGGK